MQINHHHSDPSLFGNIRSHFFRYHLHRWVAHWRYNRRDPRLSTIGVDPIRLETHKRLPCMESISHRRCSPRCVSNESSSIRYGMAGTYKGRIQTLCSLRYSQVTQVPPRKAKYNKRVQHQNNHPGSLSSPQSAQIRSLLTNSACRVFPNDAGLRSTITPAASSAVILESAPPLPPLTMAPGQQISTSDLRCVPVMGTNIYLHGPFCVQVAPRCQQ